MLSHKEFTWKLEVPNVDKTDSLTTLFKKFFTDDILEQIFIESVKYPKLKESHNFDIDIDIPKAFVTDLLISEYVDLPRYPMLKKTLQMSQITLVN